MSRWKMVLRAVPLLAMMALLLAGCGNPNLSALVPRGPVASDQYFLMMLSIAIMALVVIVVGALYIIAIVRFRKRKGQTGYPKQVEGNHTLEVIWTVVPILLLVILAVPSIMYTFKHTEDYRDNKDAIHVKVTAHQFWWEFQYPDLGVHTAQDLVIPTGKKVALEMEAADVKHSFWVPSLGGKLDTNPGIVNTYYLETDEIDTFLGKCAELCGASHALMDFKVISKSQPDFTAWVASMKAPSSVPAEASAGKTLFDNNCIACHAVDVDKGSFGPNLNKVANRTEIAGILPNTDESLHAWIKDPNAEKIGTKMPQVPLKDEEITEIVKYLRSLK